MIDEKSLQFNAYEYLKNCRNKRGGAVISDKQYIFYSQILKNDYRTHDNIAVDIETTIHPNSDRKGWDALRENNVYVFAVGPSDFRIDFPDNGELSINQATFISKLLDQIDKYDKEVEEDTKKAKVKVSNARNYLKEFEQIDTSEIREVLPKMVTKRVTIEEEKIIGQTLSKEQIKSNLVFHIELQDCTTIKEIIRTLNKCSIYYYDSYYRNIFLEIFPDYPKLINMSNILCNLNIENEKIQNVTYENIYEIICNTIKNVFKNLKTYDQLRETIYNIKYLMQENEIKDFFGNFDVFFNFVIELFPLNEEEEINFNKLISNTSNYDELVNLFFKLGYQKKKSKLEENESYLVKQQKYLEDIEIRKNISKNKEELNKMIKKGNELRDLVFTTDIELGNRDYFIDREKKLIHKNNNAIAENSNSLFRKIKDRKKIKVFTNNVNVCKLKLEKLEFEKEELIKKRAKLKDEIDLIEENFKDITHFDFFPFDDSVMQFYYNDDFYFDEDRVIKSIEKLKKEIDELKKELDYFIQMNLINSDTEILNDDKENEISSMKINR